MRVIDHTTKLVALIPGLSFYWLFLRRSYFGVLLSGYDGNTGRVLYVMFLCFVACFAVLSLAKGSRIRGVIDERPSSVVAFSTLASLASLTVHVLPNFGVLNAVFASVGMVVLAANFVLLSLTWVSAIPINAGRSFVICAILSFVASYLVSFLLLLPEPLPVALVIVAPLLSGVLWRAGSRVAPVEDSGQSDAKSVFPGMVGILMLFLLVGGIMRGLVHAGDPYYAPSSSSVLPHLISICFASLMLLVVVLSRRKERLFQSIWTVLAVVFFAGIFLLALLNDDWKHVGDGVLIAGRTCLSLLLWVMLANEVQRGGITRIAAAGAFVLSETAAAFLSYVVVPVLERSIGTSLESYIPLLSMGMALILIAASFLFLGNGAFRNDGGSAKTEPEPESEAAPANSDAWQESCDAISCKFGLTKREAEVLHLMSRGYSRNRIAEMLYVSSGTVQTHSKNIYRKLGLHSRQELIDEVARESQK